MKKIYLIICYLLIGIVLHAQSVNIEGVVKDEDGLAIGSAIVILKGTQTAVSTNDKGEFTIKVPNNNSILLFSFVGFASIELPASQNMQVRMELERATIDEVVVTGMVKTDKRLFTGASDKLTLDKMKLDGAGDISRSLEGRSAGVSVQNVSGTFGTAPKIRIRGATSIYGNSKPLWVVDGVIVEDVTDVSADNLSSGDAVTMISSAIAGLNPDDIESFQILKDGSATSIYGARAMSGVIVITTKKGKAGTTRINYSTELTTRLIPSYRNYNIMNSQDQMEVYQDLKNKGWLNFATVYNAPNSGVYGKMYQLINTYNPDTQQFGLENTEEARNAYLRQGEYRNTDWFNELFSNSIMQNHSVSIATGTEKANTYTSMSALIDPGWTKQSSVKRYTVNTNNSYKIFDFLTYNLLANVSFRDQKAPGSVTQEKNAVTGSVDRAFDINPFNFAMNTSRTMDPNEYYKRSYADFNILNELENNYIDLKVLDLKFQNEFKWKVKEGLEISVLGAIKYQTTAQQHFVTDNSNQALSYRAMQNSEIRDKNPQLYKDPDNTNALPITILDVGGFYEKREYRMLSYDFRAAASWNKRFGDHIVNAYGGMEVNAIDRTNDWFRGYGMQYDNGELPYFNYLAFKKLREGNSDYFTLKNTKRRNAAFFGNATYSYKGKYTINGTYRYEGSNRLGKSRSARWLPTWNISGAWNAYEESFFVPLKSVFSHFTIKGSYSLTADAGPEDVINSQVILKSYNPWRPSASLGESGLMIDHLENSLLTYEKKHELNIGADIGLLDNRVNLVVDWYTRNNYDLIGDINTQGIGGQILKKANVATMKSHGVEFTISTKNIQKKQFSWSTDFTFSLTKNEITKLYGDTRVMDLISGNGFAREGYAVRSLFSIPFVGLDDQGLPMFEVDGQVIDKNSYDALDFQARGDDKVSYLKYEGPTDPTMSGGFGNIITYKNFRLNVFVTYSFGNKIRLDPYLSKNYSDLGATPQEFKNRWMLPGDEARTTIPTVVSMRQAVQYGDNLNKAYNAYNYSTARIADGGFVRMKEISLTYDVPAAFIKRFKLNTMSMKAQGTNLFMLYADSKLNGQDPEFFRAGGVSVPMAKQFTFTLRFGF